MTTPQFSPDRRTRRSLLAWAAFQLASLEAGCGRAGDATIPPFETPGVPDPNTPGPPPSKKKGGQPR